MLIKDAFDRSPYQVKKHSSYFATYARLFEPYRGQKLTFVEIGILNGGSLFMWRNYWGDSVRIIGVDFNPEAAKWRSEGFEVFIGDQADPSFWADFFQSVGPVDIVLDDGGHTFEQQIVTYECTLPHVRDGGLLVIEDTHTSYMKQFGGPSPRSFVSFAKNIVDGIHFRSELIDQDDFERQVAFVSFFESIVAFFVDRTIAGEKSRPVANAGVAAGAVDYRYATSLIGRTVEALTRKYLHLRTTPLVGPAAARAWKAVQSSTFYALSKRSNLKLRRHFRY